MIFVDSNIPMYLVGGTHPNKTVAQRLLERHIVAADRLVTDVEVFQEILHRYVAIRRHDAVQPAFDALLGVVDDVFPVELEDVWTARAIVEDASASSARDAVHLAVMRRHGIGRILTFDRAFERAGVQRIVE